VLVTASPASTLRSGFFSNLDVKTRSCNVFFHAVDDRFTRAVDSSPLNFQPAQLPLIDFEATVDNGDGTLAPVHEPCTGWTTTSIGDYNKTHAYLVAGCNSRKALVAWLELETMALRPIRAFVMKTDSPTTSCVR
jgi:hypothetical protein